MGHLSTFLALAGAAVLSGCVYWTAPVQTRIVDASTGQPITHASVVAWPAGRERKAETFMADEAGRVTIPSLTFFMPLPGDPGLSYPLALRVDAEGYLTLDHTDLGHPAQIELEPDTRPDEAP